MNYEADLLSEYATKYIHLYEMPKKSYFENLVSLITAQEVRFKVGRNIRKKLYTLVNTITPQTIGLLSIDLLQSIGLSKLRAQTLINLAKTNDDTINGIGPWTIKGAKLLTYNVNSLECQGIALYEDMWIRKRLGELLGQKTLKISKSKEFFDGLSNPAIVSYFLWRIQPHGIAKILIKQELTLEDFI